MFARLSAEPAPAAIEPLPGWFARRRREIRPASAVLAALPTGPSVARNGRRTA
jgi:hypothetical protein